MDDRGDQVTQWLEAGGWLDVSRPLAEGIPVWPGDRPFELKRRLEHRLVISSLATTCHVGTHLDAPLHLEPGVGGVEATPIGRLVGRAEVVWAPCSGGAVGVGDLPAGWSPGSPRVLVRTDSHPLGAVIGDSIAGMSPELVGWLADRGVELVGIDSPSVDPFEAEGLPAHRALLARGMSWIEGLWLDRVEPGTYLLAALPLALVGAEAAPLRALLRPLPRPAEGRAR